MILTIIFGLLQLWLVLGYNLVVIDNMISYEEIFLEGFLLFFITAIVSTITVDFFLSDIIFSRLIVGILFVLLPCIILFISVGVFCVIVSKSKSELDVQVIETLQLVLITMTVVYGISIKTLKFQKANE